MVHSYYTKKQLRLSDTSRRSLVRAESIRGFVSLTDVGDTEYSTIVYSPPGGIYR